MKKALVKYNEIKAGVLTEEDDGTYVFEYDSEYVKKHPKKHITFSMPVMNYRYKSKRLFPFFDGLIPEGWLLNIAAKSWRIDKNNRMDLLLACCKNAIGAVSIHTINSDIDV